MQEENREICPHFGLCGGCTYQDMSYEEQLEKKVLKVKDLMRPFAGDDVWENAVFSPRIRGYRNKMEFSFGDDRKDGPLTLGLHQKKSFYNVITVDGCNIVDEDYRKILTATLEFFGQRGISYYHKRRQSGALRHLVIRKAAKTGEILVLLAAASELLLYDGAGVRGLEKTPASENSLLRDFASALLSLKLDGEIAGILFAKNDLPADTVQSQETTVLYGREFFFEELLGLKFKITPFSFFQTNSLGAERLYSVVREYCGDIAGQKIFDLYSGTGTIAQILASVAERVTGVEIVEEAVVAARENAALNGLDNCNFIAGDVFEVLSRAAGEAINAGKGTAAGEDTAAGSVLFAPDFIVLDPPREGMTPKALSKILSYEVPRIVYVSCKPESLARDMETFAARGYQIRRIRCVDMFPWTKHVETVVSLSRK